jgi:nitrate reductase molybdenum cofactor assembly chaperone NarJ/NarW
VILKLLSVLLRYPDDEVLRHRAEISAAVRELSGSPAKDAALTFLAYWENEPASRLQASYIEAFDFKRRGCLYLSYYRYGDSRARGQVLADMKETYARAGYPLDTTKLPDYLPLVLEFASEVPEEGLPMLAENRAAIEVIRRSLRYDGSSHAHLHRGLDLLPAGTRRGDRGGDAEAHRAGAAGERGLRAVRGGRPAGGQLGNVVFEGRKR